MMHEMNIPLVAGGLMDQPHIWLLEYAVVRNTKALFDNIAQQQALAEASQKKG